MHGLSSISFETGIDDYIVLTASGFHMDPLRVLLMTEADYVLAMRSGADIVSKSRAMPILSSETPKIKLTMPFPGKWCIVYQTKDAESVSVKVVTPE